MHFIRRNTLQVITILLLAVALAACGGGAKESRNNDQNNQAESNAQQSAVSEASEDAAGEADTTIDTTVSVVARDFEFSLDAASATAGTISFVMSNEGAMPHDFAITVDGKRYKTEMIKPGDSGSVTVELPAGTYEYICTIPGHDILGMKGTFTVN